MQKVSRHEIFHILSLKSPKQIFLRDQTVQLFLRFQFRESQQLFDQQILILYTQNYRYFGLAKSAVLLEINRGVQLIVFESQVGWYLFQGTLGENGTLEQQIMQHFN